MVWANDLDGLFIGNLDKNETAKCKMRPAAQMAFPIIANLMPPINTTKRAAFTSFFINASPWIRSPTCKGTSRVFHGWGA